MIFSIIETLKYFSFDVDPIRSKKHTKNYNENITPSFRDICVTAPTFSHTNGIKLYCASFHTQSNGKIIYDNAWRGPYLCIFLRHYYPLVSNSPLPATRDLAGRIHEVTFKYEYVVSPANNLRFFRASEPGLDALTT